ncbi:hypothetical protein [Mycobacterium sp. D16Q16]|uniref:hypothetical protein n=1 Tax=Mycobacterium sp. D16Q16 TaxID=1855659 RepID=UPI00111708C4|nr:hypothetical protein [Mycobacterium sp. D16Q16]
MTLQEDAVLPAAYAENLANPAPAHTGVRNALRRWTGFDLTPSDEVVRQYGEGLWITDPVAERFVADANRHYSASDTPSFDAFVEWLAQNAACRAEARQESLASIQDTTSSSTSSLSNSLKISW